MLPNQRSHRLVGLRKKQDSYKVDVPGLRLNDSFINQKRNTKTFKISTNVSKYARTAVLLTLSLSEFKKQNVLKYLNEFQHATAYDIQVYGEL